MSQAQAISIGYVCSLAFTEQCQKSSCSQLFVLATGKWWKSLHCQNALRIPSVSFCVSFGILWIILKSLRYVKALKLFRNLFQNWHLTKNDQKWPKMTQNKIERPWLGGGFFVVVVVKIFWVPPRPVWTPASQAPCGCARLTPGTQGRPQAAGFAGITFFVIANQWRL